MKQNNTKEMLLYVFFGGLTTLVSIISYFLLRLLLDVLSSQIISWTLAVLFAFTTNKLFVFESTRGTIKKLIQEIGMFFAARITTGLLELFLINIFITNSTEKCREFTIKIIITVIVIVLNYVFSKLFVFAKRGSK